MLARQTLEQADEFPRLWAAVFVAGEHIGEHVEDSEAGTKLGHEGVESMIHRRGHHSAPHQLPEHAVFSNKIDKSHVC